MRTEVAGNPWGDGLDRLSQVLPQLNCLWINRQSQFADLCPAFKRILEAQGQNPSGEWTPEKQEELLGPCDPRIAVLLATDAASWLGPKDRQRLRLMANELSHAFFHAEFSCVSASTFVFDGIDDLMAPSMTEDADDEEHFQQHYDAQKRKYRSVPKEIKGVEFLARNAFEWITLSYIQIRGLYDRMARILGLVVFSCDLGRKADYGRVTKDIDKAFAHVPGINANEDWIRLRKATSPLEDLAHIRNLLAHRVTLSQRAFTLTTVAHTLEEARDEFARPASKHIEELAAHLDRASNCGLALARFIRHLGDLAWSGRKGKA